MKYKIYCRQRGIYFADGEPFNTLEECREQLISYHNADYSHAELKKMTLDELCENFDWEIHEEK